MKLRYMVKTEIIKIKELNKYKLKKISRDLNNGKIIIYPTETCYGIGTNALNKKAVERIYKIKKEPTKSNIIVIVSDLKAAEKYGVVGMKAKKLIKSFMPGPLTLIVKKKKVFPDITNKDFAFRISGNKLARKIAKMAGVPITATSANIHGEKSIYSSDKIVNQFNGRVDIILDAGKLKKIKPSTIIDIKNERPKLIRKGPISFRQVLTALK